MWSNFNQAASALRFLYGITLGRTEDVPRISYGRRPKKLPVVLDREEVMELLTCISDRKHRTVLTTMYATGMRVGEAVRLLQQEHDSGKLGMTGRLAPLNDHQQFRNYLSPLYRQDWNVYSKPPWSGPEQVLKYLARYTHRVAISNERVVSTENGRVTFRWKNYRERGRQQQMTLEADEFLRRFLLHVLPAGFVRIRSFGFLANGHRADKLAWCRKLLETDAPQVATRDELDNGELTPEDSGRCPFCRQGTLHLVTEIERPKVSLLIAWTYSWSQPP